MNEDYPFENGKGRPGVCNLELPFPLHTPHHPLFPIGHTPPLCSKTPHPISQKHLLLQDSPPPSSNPYSPSHPSPMATSLLLSSSFLSSSPLSQPRRLTSNVPTSCFPYARTSAKLFLKSTHVPSCSFRFCHKIMAGTSIGETEEEGVEPVTVGEDSAAFDLGQQKISSWIYFGGILGVVLFLLDVVWIDNSTGFGKDFIAAVAGVSESHEVNNIIVLIIHDNS